MNVLEQYKEHLLPQYSNFPKGKYVTLIAIRKTESETILRTEGSGPGVSAGPQSQDGQRPGAATPRGNRSKAHAHPG